MSCGDCFFFFGLAFRKDYFRARVNKQRRHTKNMFIQKKHSYEKKIGSGTLIQQTRKKPAAIEII